MRSFLYCLFAFILSACDVGQHVYYAPSAHQVPLFKEKNDIRFSGNLGGGEETRVTCMHAAVSVSRKCAVMANYQAFTNNSNSVRNGVRSNNYNGNSFDVAFGYYKANSKFTVFEVYGGIGWLGQNHNYTQDSTYYTVSNWGWLGTYTTQHTLWLNRGSAYFGSMKYYIQSQFGFTSKYFDGALSVRFTNLYFSTIDNKVQPNYAMGYNEVEMFRTRRNCLMMEPAFTVRAGWPNIKFQLQFGFAEALTNDLRFVAQTTSFGINFSFIQKPYQIPIPKN